MIRIVAAPTLRNLRKVLRTVGNTPFSWAYLGSDIQGFQIAGKAFQNPGTLVETTGRFHEAAEDLREPYLRLIYDIGRESNSLLWWVTSLSYRSRAVSKTFQQACYLKIVLCYCVFIV